MDETQVQARIAAIRQAAERDDDEAAHSLEDQLFFDLLHAIAEGRCENPAACCGIAITTQGIEFARWTA